MLKLNQINKASRISKLAIDIGVSKNFTKKDNVYIGKLVYNSLKDLGPTFIKIGQFLSTRSDIFGADFTDQLKGLQDNVAPMSKEDIAPLIERISSNFEYINDVPIAAASIGQVHIGKMTDGTPTAIKFKRRYISETINADFTMLLSIINFLKIFISHRQITEIEISLKEYYNLLLEEIDFYNEVSNMKSFKSQFKSTKWIKVPMPYEGLCDNDIIVMEYVPAAKINDLIEIEKMNFDPSKISEKLLECFFIQIVQNGFVHIDPHPGNVGIDESGKIVFYDYGMFVKLDESLKDNIKDLFLALYDRDVEEVCKILVDLQIIIVEPDKLPSFKKFIASLLSYIDNLDIDNFKLGYLDKIDQSEMQFLISSKFILLLRGITILEGICKNLNPTFSYRETLDPFISDFIIDVDYFERRGKRDISRYRNAPDKIEKSEISIGMVETDIEVLKKKMMTVDLRSKYIYTAIILSIVLQTEYIETRIILALAFMYIILNR
jgi:predicted unusual protein kinase regulating ubiquinone biosynthesis (AarF/ABC1/UbiB family)